jgi:putative aldouronate transport system permease protein
LGIIIAFKDYTFVGGIFGSEWTSSNGFKHFIRFMSNPEFWRIFRNTIILAALRILVTFPAPIILALLLNEVKSPAYKKILQTFSYLPHFVSFVIVYAVFFSFFQNNGFINDIRVSFGLPRLIFFGDPKLYRQMFVGLALWQEIGWGAIIYLAAITQVNVELYEAAELDGANKLQMMWHITLPAMRPIIGISFVLAMGGILNVSFDQTLVMRNPVVSSVADVLSYYIYQIGLLSNNQYSYATAMGLFNSILSLSVVLLTNYFAKRIDEDSALW